MSTAQGPWLGVAPVCQEWGALVCRTGRCARVKGGVQREGFWSCGNSGVASDCSSPYSEGGKAGLLSQGGVAREG